MLYHHAIAGAENLVAGQPLTGAPASKTPTQLAADLVNTLPLPGDPEADAAAKPWGVRIANSRGLQVLNAGLFARGDVDVDVNNSTDALAVQRVKTSPSTTSTALEIRGSSRC